MSGTRSSICAWYDGDQPVKLPASQGRQNVIKDSVEWAAATVERAAASVERATLAADPSRVGLWWSTLAEWEWPHCEGGSGRLETVSWLAGWPGAIHHLASLVMSYWKASLGNSARTSCWDIFCSLVLSQVPFHAGVDPAGQVVPVYVCVHRAVAGDILSSELVNWPLRYEEQLIKHPAFENPARWTLFRKRFMHHVSKMDDVRLVSPLGYLRRPRRQKHTDRQ